MSRAWEAVALFIVAMVIINIVIASVEPYLPIVGAVVLGCLIYIAVRFVIRRRI